MASIWNQLEKLAPPSFVTTPTSKAKLVIQKWSNLIIKSRSGKLKNQLILESNILNGYIERKGTQLRLERALMFTKQIQKLLQRWKSNDFHTQLLQFQKSVGNFDVRTGYLVSAKSNVSKGRLPSLQWVRWVIYSALRDVVLLAKVVADCENTAKFWFGLIDAGHHWGDSLVIGGILARIWFISSKYVEDLHHLIYPCLMEISLLVEPNKSGDWPGTEFQPPADVLNWLRTSMGLSYIPVASGQFGKLIKTGNKAKERSMQFLDGILGLQNEIEEHSVVMEDSNLRSDQFEEADEDFGVVVDVIAPRLKGKKKGKSEKKKEADNLVAVEKTDATWKTNQLYWNKFFKNYETKCQSIGGRKMLLTRTKKYLKTEENQRLKVKLKKLKRCLLKFDGNSEGDLATEFTNFKMFITKYVKRLKKS